MVSQRMTRAGGSGVGGGGGIPTPRVTFPRHSENDAPTTALAASIPAPITTLAKPVGAAHVSKPAINRPTKPTNHIRATKHQMSQLRIDSGCFGC